LSRLIPCPSMSAPTTCSCPLSFSSDGHPPALHSFPTRRSSDLLQEHVKAAIAPYKYPRSIEFTESLPRTETGKLQRFVFRKQATDRKSTRLNSSHVKISYAVFCLKKKKRQKTHHSV